MEFPNQQCPSGTPHYVLKLKVGALIMFPSNLDHRKGLLNGPALVVKGLHAHFINAEIISGRTECKPLNFIN
jgi:hypothetical protein